VVAGLQEPAEVVVLAGPSIKTMIFIILPPDY